MDEQSTGPWSRAAFLAISMTLLGRALQIADGELSPPPHPAIAWLTAAIVAAGLSVLTPKWPRIGRRSFQSIVAVCLLINFIQLVSKSPAVGITVPGQWAPYSIGFVAVSFLCGIVLVSQGAAQRAAMSGVLALTAILGGWTIVKSPDPKIDVFTFQVDSARALQNGVNPYTITFPDTIEEDTPLYGPGIQRGGRLEFGYPYLPETLYAVMPASLLQFDVRFTLLAAVLGAAILILCVNRTILGFSAVLLLVTTPRLYFILEKSWVEPVVIIALVWTIACSIRWPKILPIALGAFLASKQYIPIAVPLFFVGNRPISKTLMLLLKAGIVAAIVTLPMMLWNVHAFVHSAIELQFQQPFRPDSLSYLAWVGEHFWTRQMVVLIPFAAFVAAMSLALWRRRSIGFASALAICFLLFFALNKQAFANYYFFVIGAMACAIIEPSPASPTPPAALE